MHKALVLVTVWLLRGLGAIALLLLIGVSMALARALKGSAAQPWTPAEIPEAEARAAREGYVHRCLVALDMMLNVWLFRGNPDETISTHAWRAAKRGVVAAKVLLWWLDLLDPHHGHLAAAADIERGRAIEGLLMPLLDSEPTPSK